MSITSYASSGMLTVSEAAERESLAVSTIRNAIRDGELVGRRIGRAVRIRVADLEAWERSLPTMGPSEGVARRKV
ncbi:MAG: Helix-turn-helix domain [Acidimicrobiaceae bacterium]|nr:Helix-turn-helix domain [Acidimicrobiaceae bacterium]